MTTPSGNRIHVSGRLVVLTHGTKSQTVAICTAANEVGTYAERWRLGPLPSVAGEELAELADLDALRAWLLSHDAVPADATAGRGAHLPSLVEADEVSQDWLNDASAAVERTITTAVEQFIQDPYLHRVEHSLHAELYRLLKQEPILAQPARLRTGELTQLVHKEWPETHPRQKEGAFGPRGLFDLAVLAPVQVQRASLEQFRSGRVAAPIVIEVGLDYGLRHLQQDQAKVLNSRVRAPYLLHLSRVAVIDAPAVEALVESPEPVIKAAYVHHNPRTGTVTYKHLTDARAAARPSSA